MDKWQDLYVILQVHPDAEQDMIQNAYKRLCKKYHPDVNASPSAAEKIKKINGAYEVLGDEVRRRAYHREWALRNQPRLQAGHTEVRERIVYVNREPQPAHGGTQAAYQVVRDYFTHLSSGRYKEAFALVSEADRKHISYGDFVEWQEAVTAIYEIGSFDLKLFKRYDKLKLNHELNHKTEEYSVSMFEKNKNTGRVRHYTLSKYAVLEGFVWKVYLGYRNLAPIMMQFRIMATTPEEAQIVGLWDRYREEHDLHTGLPNRVRFELEYDTLVYSHKRYGRDFSLTVLQTSLPKSGETGGQLEFVVKYVGYILNKGVRCIDKVAYLGDGCFGVLLPETDKKTAAQAARRLLKCIRHDIAACFDFEIHIRAGIACYAGQSAAEAIAGCLRTIRAASPDSGAATESGSGT